MLWYLLYPIRGTTEAPVLAPTHPLRAAFSRYGTWAARHVQTVLPISTAVVFIFLYLFPHLYTTDTTNITSGVSNLPHHVWTDAQPLSSSAVVDPDVIMRSIWVHGSYMKALDRDVLLGALELQDALLGPTTDFNPRRPTNALELPDTRTDLNQTERDTFHIVNGLTDKSWFFHSPLQYWSGSAANINADEDIVSTVNARKTQSTSVNVTLRHSIVFSGKRFEERKLVAADALVITLIHLRDSPVGKQWVRKAKGLAEGLRDKWTIIPEDGTSTSRQLYEFQFRPMSWLDLIILSIAYSLTLVYLVLSLSRLHAVKSRLGLMVTIVLQIAASIVSSFTVCAIFKIDLSRIPYYAYPLVVLAVSMENSLRLINAVIMTSSSISISARIGEAFGATAHVAVANRLQNLLILLGLSRITVPGVAAFCTFAAVAIVFDFFYLATFFLSVLSVDVRQRELSELEKASLKRTKSQQASHDASAWTDTMRQVRLGEIALSTRVAGTIVALGFVLIAQSHYAPESGRRWLNQIFQLSWANTTASPKSSLLIDIHQARSPTSWLRLQDHETAREVIKVVKPWAHSYVALVYDPIIFVLKGSDRIPHTREPYFLPALYDFFHNEIPQFVVLLVIIITVLIVFTNHLVRDGYKDGGDPEHPDDEPLLTVQALRRDHTLDVVMMTASPGGLLVSVGLDRIIQVWDVPGGTRSRVMSDSEVPLENPFPVLGIAVDDDSKQVALVSWNRVFVWNLEERQWGPTVQIELRGHKPEAVFYNARKADSPPPLVIVRRDGTMVEIRPETEETSEFVVCKTPLVSAVPFSTPRTYPAPWSILHPTNTSQDPTTQRPNRMAILTASRKSCVHLVRQTDDGWTSDEIKFLSRDIELASKGVHTLIPIPAFSAYLVGRPRSIDLVDLDSSVTIHSFATAEPMQPRSLKHIIHSKPAGAGLLGLTLAYVGAETGDLVVQTHLSDDTENAVIYAPHGGQAWAAGRVETRRVGNPGTWEALGNGSVVGVRQRDCAPDDDSTEWEAWVLSHLDNGGGDFEARPLHGAQGGGKNTPPQVATATDHLMIAALGPMVRLGTMSVAVGYGNAIKIVSAGHEYFDDVARDQRLGLGGAGMGGG
ncbi:sterol regulatory element-binding protein cleavage-activating protein, partial [Podospora conica]